MNPNPPPAKRPSGAEVVAYVDGELDPISKQCVEAWLAHHPEAAAEIDIQRRLARLWQTTLPPDPPEAKWNAALAHIETALAAGKGHRK